jgi:hypothetical protein
LATDVSGAEMAVDDIDVLFFSEVNTLLDAVGVTDTIAFVIVEL